MIVAVQGTAGFQDYMVLLRAMGVAMSSLAEEDPYFYIYSAGPANINNMLTEFTNLSERGMRSRRKKIKMYKVPPSWIEENISNVNYFAFLSLPNERISNLAKMAQLNNVDVGFFSY